jgi:SAM-dependent methyltransferase
MECVVCKSRDVDFVYRETVSSDLAKIWGLSAKEVAGINTRESGNCSVCGCSLRSRLIAKAILAAYPESESKYFVDWVEWATSKNISIAEINYCGELHKFLSQIPGTIVSQYYESTWRAKIANIVKGIKSVDINHTNYPDDRFDLVLHTEVLEHIDDAEGALAECRRIIKPGGKCLFTIPILMDRQTKRKASIDPSTGKVIFYGEPSFHGREMDKNYVFWEFGSDFIKKNKLKIQVANPRNYTWVLKLEK